MGNTQVNAGNISKVAEFQPPVLNVCVCVCIGAAFPFGRAASRWRRLDTLSWHLNSLASKETCRDINNSGRSNKRDAAHIHTDVHARASAPPLAERHCREIAPMEELETKQDGTKISFRENGRIGGDRRGKELDGQRG